MKERKYYEQLISDNLDGPLGAEQRAELATAIDKDESLRLFRDALANQSLTFENLPKQTAEHLRLSGMNERKKGWLRRMWSFQISIPVPAAALMVVAVAIAFGVLSPEPETGRGTKPQNRNEVRYVQMIRLEPAAAVVVDKKSMEKNKNGSKS